MKPGDTLPSLKALAVRHDVSTATIGRALRHIASKYRLVESHGSSSISGGWIVRGGPSPQTELERVTIALRKQLVEMEDGAHLPSTKELGSHHGVSRTNIQHALAGLAEHDGQVESRGPGRGGGWVKAGGRRTSLNERASPGCA
ncbi:MAG: GntR family transcriptional regulator [Pseudonocardia sp.]|nr:GntR family transcriptional regulator [Pseudonocardia sp.]